MTEFEKVFWAKGELVAGVDEAGRGPLAGPVFAAAVVFPIDYENKWGINDSKKLSEATRNQLFGIILQESISYCISQISNYEIDKHNILQSALTAMNESIHKLEIKPNHLLIDGNYFRLNSMNEYNYTTVVKGDSKSVSIAAASILAKVSRDNWMIEVSPKYPEYGFEQHKGYATKKHFEAIEKYGTCELHRETFLKKFFSRQQQFEF